MRGLTLRCTLCAQIRFQGLTKGSVKKLKQNEDKDWIVFPWALGLGILSSHRKISFTLVPPTAFLTRSSSPSKRAKSCIDETTVKGFISSPNSSINMWRAERNYGFWTILGACQGGSDSNIFATSLTKFIDSLGRQLKTDSAILCVQKGLTKNKIREVLGGTWQKIRRTIQICLLNTSNWAIWVNRKLRDTPCSASPKFLWNFNHVNIPKET